MTPFLLRVLRVALRMRHLRRTSRRPSAPLAASLAGEMLRVRRRPSCLNTQKAHLLARFAYRICGCPGAVTRALSLSDFEEGGRRKPTPMAPTPRRGWDRGMSSAAIAVAVAAVAVAAVAVAVRWLVAVVGA